MEKYFLTKDINTCCITAGSFPEGVQAAHLQLHSLFQADGHRRYFGISYGSANGKIIYKAAAEELPGDETKGSNLEKFLIKKGEYNCITIHKFMDNIPAIGKAFETLLTSTNPDPNGYCLEWYLENNNLRCMVPVDNNKNLKK